MVGQLAPNLVDFQAPLANVRANGDVLIRVGPSVGTVRVSLSAARQAQLPLSKAAELLLCRLPSLQNPLRLLRQPHPFSPFRKILDKCLRLGCANPFQHFEGAQGL